VLAQNQGEPDCHGEALAAAAATLGQVGPLKAERIAYTAGASFTPLTTEAQRRNKVRASTVRSSNDDPPRTSTRQCCPGPIGCIPVMAPVAKTMPARTG
jgi:hypothetical protein